MPIVPDMPPRPPLPVLERLVQLPGALVDAADDALEGTARRRWREAPLALLLAGPATGLLAVFGILPLLLAVWLSLFSGKGFSMRFAWLSNYVSALGNPEFWNALSVTLYYVAGTIPATIALSFVIASGLNRVRRSRGFFRTLYFLPYVTSVVAAATVWTVLLHPRNGPVNVLLGRLGVPPESWPAWLMDPTGVLHYVTGGLAPPDAGPSLALVCVMFFDIWHTSGFMVVVLLAGLTAIPRELEEAALIDGAGWFRRSLHVTIPLLSPTLFFLLIISVIKAFQAFNSFYALTGNGRGPLDTTQNMTVYIFTNLYVYQRLGYGAAVATLLAVAIVVLTLVQWRFLGRRVHYG